MSMLRMEEFPVCIICEVSGERLYSGLKDRVFGVEGRFDLRRCPSCGLIWMDPRPHAEDIQKCYENYYTHDTPAEINFLSSDPRRPFAFVRDAIRTSILCGYYGYRHLHRNHVWCGFGPLLARIPFLRNRAIYYRGVTVPRFNTGLIIDIGCGNSNYLKFMKALGWEVLGVEPDRQSSQIAAEVYGIPVFNGTLEEASLSPSIAYQITMNHVLEHLPDPYSTLRECYKILKPGGRLILYTPNAQSLGHKVFAENYIYLDPPRHLFVFSPKSMHLFLEKTEFRKFYIKTIMRAAGFNYDTSLLIYRKGKIDLKEVTPQKGRRFFIFKEYLLCKLGKELGEEIEVVAIKT